MESGLLFAVIYFVIMIVFTVIKVQKKKAGGRKTWTPPDKNAASAQSRPDAGGARGAWTPPEQADVRPSPVPKTIYNAFPAGQLSAGKEKSILDDIWSELLGGEEDADSGSAADGGDVVEEAWRQFRPDAEPGAPRPVAAPAASANAGENAAAAALNPSFTFKEESAAGREPGPLPEAGGKHFNAWAAPAPKPEDGFSARLARLSPLQQAVVMAEVLGKPRGLKAYDES